MTNGAARSTGLSVVPMDFDVQQGFRVGAWEVYPQLNRLVSSQGRETLEGKVMAVLVEIAKNPEQVISKGELLDAVWPNQNVAEGVLTRAIHELRHALGDHAHEPLYIENVPRLGYRLLCPIEPLVAPIDVSNNPQRRRLFLAAAAVVVVLAMTLIGQFQRY